jgi:methionyl-tRNA formyltransferase
MRILLVAEESAGLRVLNDLLLSPHQVAAVMCTAAGGMAGRNHVWERARQSGCDVWPAQLVREPSLAGRIRSGGIDILLNVHSLHVVHEEVVDAPRVGSFNLHPGPLPEYAGLNAPSWALYNGESMHGVTLHWMDAGIDSGAIAFEERFPLTDEDNGLSVAARCARSAVPLVRQLLAAAEQGPANVPCRRQDKMLRRYFGAEVPQNGVIEWDRTARQVFNFIRACDYTPFPSPWGEPNTCCDGANVAITHAALTGEIAGAEPGTVRHSAGSRVLVACSDEWLEVRGARIAGCPVSPPAALRSGHQPSACWIAERA